MFICKELEQRLYCEAFIQIFDYCIQVMTDKLKYLLHVGALTATFQGAKYLRLRVTSRYSWRLANQ